MSSRYLVYEDNELIREHLGLIGACIDARETAKYRPGSLCRVERDGKMEARYQVVHGKLDAWMK